MKRSSISILLLAAAVGAGAACQRAPEPEPMPEPTTADSLREAGREATDAAREAGRDMMDAARDATGTVNVKAALMLDNAVDASSIDVDTDAAARVVTLRGYVPTGEQRTRAEEIATREAPGYRIDNQLRLATP